MRYILNITAFFIFQLLLLACNQPSSQKWDNYPKDSSVSNTQGQARNSSTLYLPYTIKKQDFIKHTNLDTIINKWYSFTLYKFNEPVLSNYYLGKDIYRFLWLRSFHRPVVITLCKDKDNITLTTKELNGQVHYFELKHCINCDTSNLEEPKLILNETIQLSLKEWDNFENLLTQCDFWNIAPFKREIGQDGAEWNIEAHLQEKYWFVNRWAPKDKFTECGKYLIKLSGLKEDIY